MNLNIRKIFIIGTIVICIIAIILAIYFHITQDSTGKSNEEEILIDTVFLTENFDDIFDNQINYQENTINTQKEEHDKELVYTSYLNQDVSIQSYELNVNIPCLNINTDTAKTINGEINSLFYDKVKSIISETNKKTIYNVQYKAYVNDNILSLIIKATLKEGDNAQRLIIKTYNYNLSSNNQLNIEEALQYRKISSDYAQTKINKTIRAASEDVSQYKELGYNKYLRDINSSMYLLENTNVYFLGENKVLYIIYPYGNQRYTSEFDLLVI